MMDKAVVREKNALAWSVAILAGLWTWVTLYPAIGFWVPSYVVFFTWASSFLAGGDMNGFKNSLRMNITGALLAYIGILLAGPLSFLGFYALPAAIFIVCFPLCLLAVWKAFEITPCGFIGAASLFAVFNSVTLNPAGVHQVLLSTLVAIILGNLTLFPCLWIINKIVSMGAKQNV